MFLFSLSICFSSGWDCVYGCRCFFSLSPLTILNWNLTGDTIALSFFRVLSFFNWNVFALMQKGKQLLFHCHFKYISMSVLIGSLPPFYLFLGFDLNMFICDPHVCEEVAEKQLEVNWLLKANISKFWLVSKALLDSNLAFLILNELVLDRVK